MFLMAALTLVRIFLVGCSEKTFIKEGFRNWKKAIGKDGSLTKHSNSRMHQLSVERAVSRQSSVPIQAIISANELANLSKREKEKEENRKIVEVIFDVIHHLAMLSVAFRAHDEKAEAINQGNFLEEVKFLAKYYPPLQSWLNKHPGTVSWLGHHVQNEMIEIISEHVLETIKSEVKDSKFFAVECDEVTSHKHSYMSVVLRYVFNDVIYERLVGMKHVTSLKGKDLSDILVKELSRMQIPLIDIIGKGFDGCSNMSVWQG